MTESEPWITLKRGFEENFKLVTDPAKEAYVAMANSTVLGFVLLHLQGPLNGYLQAIAVAAERRGSGVGRKLIEFAEQRVWAVSPNFFLCVSSFNTRAQKLYATLGYQRVGELKDYVVKGHSEILLRKTRGPLAEFRPTPAEKPPGRQEAT